MPLPGPLRAGPFRMLFAARAISSLGDRLAPVALVFAVLDLTRGSVTDLGIVMGAQTAAIAAFVLVGGVWADRLPRRAVMLASDGVRMVAQGASAALLLAGSAQVWQLAALQALYGAAEGFFGPASIALVGQTVVAGELQRANALLGLTDNVASVLGPAVAGALVAGAGAGWGLAGDAATFALSALALAAMRLGPEAAHVQARARSMLSDLREGWRSFASRRWLWASVAYFTLFLALVYAPFQVLGPQVARTALGGAGAWAAISVALGLGSVAGGLLGMRWRPAHPLRVTVLTFAVIEPALLVLLGLHAALAAIIVVALLDGSVGSLFNAFWYTAMQSRIPPGELSRVTSWDYLGSLVLQPAGLAATGPVAGALGVSATLYGAAGLAVLLAAAVLAVSAVWNFTLRDDGPSPRPLESGA